MLADPAEPDIVAELESRARAGAETAAAQAARTGAKLVAWWERWVTWLSGTAPGIWTRSLRRQWLLFVPVDARDIRREDFLAILRALEAGAQSFGELEASLARYVIKRPGTPDPALSHGPAYRRSEFCDFRTSARLRYAWSLLCDLRLVVMSGQPEFEAELTSLRVQTIAHRLIAMENGRWKNAGKLAAECGRQILVWETSFAKSRTPARIGLRPGGVAHAIIADPDFWFRGDRLPITRLQQSRLWETWIFFIGSVGGAFWSIVSALTAHDLPRHVRPSLLFFSLCCVVCATLLAVRVAPMFGSFWSELMLVDFRSLPLIESTRALYDRREAQREKRRNAAGEHVWEFAREAEIERLSRDAPVVVRTDVAAEVVKGTSTLPPAVASPSAVNSAVVIPGAPPPTAAVTVDPKPEMVIKPTTVPSVSSDETALQSSSAEGTRFGPDSNERARV
jgi:hypothetical protein